MVIRKQDIIEEEWMDTRKKEAQGRRSDMFKAMKHYSLPEALLELASNRTLYRPK
jgi:hypothetical protein